VADIKILAEGAKEIAGAEKNCAGTAPANQGGFLSEMGVQACHSCPAAGTAKTHFAGKPIDVTFPWAQGAASHQINGLIDPFLQFSIPVQSQI